MYVDYIIKLLSVNYSLSVLKVLLSAVWTRKGTSLFGYTESFSKL